MAAGHLREIVDFQKRVIVDDGYGNTISGDWKTEFCERARLMPLKGGESILASRLDGVQPFILTVRSNCATRDVNNSWRAVNSRSGTIYNIRTAANMDEKNQYVSMMVDDGVVT